VWARAMGARGPLAGARRARCRCARPRTWRPRVDAERPHQVVHLARQDPVHVRLHTTAHSARSMRRRASKSEGAKLPARSLGIRSSRSPAFVDSSRSRAPFRWVLRSGLRHAPEWALRGEIAAWPIVRNVRGQRRGRPSPDPSQRRARRATADRCGAALFPRPFWLDPMVTAGARGRSARD
jgi:hypothetical protein